MTSLSVENVTQANDIETKSIEDLVKEIRLHKEQSAVSFYEIGIRLKLIKDKELYKQKGFPSFSDFLRTPEVDFSSVIADRFITMSQDDDLKKSLYLGSAKVTEILKLSPEHRKKLLSGPVEIKGAKKNLDDLSLNELKKISQNFKREGKFKCDRCGRWVDHLKELDGKFYGVGSKHSCYEQEVEDRRSLQENAIPTEQFDNVLDNLKKTSHKEEKETETPVENNSINWLPESIYQVYGQFLGQYKDNTEELSLDSLQKEEETINKLVQLLKSRLKDIKDTITVLESNT